MPVTVDTTKDLRPIIQAKPDMRFATTFISNKYRDFAVKGETLMDKATGEIFTKRPEDGRVVSFFQNKKYMSELMLDLRVMLNNNGSFIYPNTDNTDACYLSTDYDMMSLYDNQDINIIDNDQIIPNTENSITQIQFNLSNNTNGFFCRLTSRDSDKSIIEWITNQYNSICKNYNGDDIDFINEKEKFNLIEKWEDSNAVINYDVIVTLGEDIITYPVTDYIRINEESCVIFPSSIGNATLQDADSIVVKINTISYEKIHFMFNHKLELGDKFTDGLNKFIYPDNAIYIRYCNICSFVDSSTDIHLLGNEFIIAMMDVPYVRRYMMKMSKLTSESNIILSPTRPSDDIWSTNGIWAEQVRDVFRGGETIELDCEINLKQLEMYLAKNDDTEYVNLSTTKNNTDIYVELDGDINA